MPSRDLDSKSDKRLLERELNQARLHQPQLDEYVRELPDLSERLLEREGNELEALAQDLVQEKTVRDERIKKLLEEPPRKAPIAHPPPEVPFEE